MAANSPPNNNNPKVNLQTFLARIRRLTGSVRNKGQATQENKQPLQEFTPQEQAQSFANRFKGDTKEQQIRRIASQLKRDFGESSDFLTQLTKVHPGYRSLNPKQVLDKLLSTYATPDYQRIDPYLVSLEAGYEPKILETLEQEKKKEEEQKPIEERKEKKEEERKKSIGGATKKQEEKTEEQKAAAKTEGIPEQKGADVSAVQKTQEAVIPPRWENLNYNTQQEQTERLIREQREKTQKLINEENKRRAEFWKKQEEENESLFTKNRRKMEEAFKSSREKQVRLFEKPRRIENKFYSFGREPQAQQTPSYTPSPSLANRPAPRIPLSPPGLGRKAPASLAGTLTKTTAKRYLLIPLIIAILVIGFFTVLYPIFDNLLKSTALLPADQNQGEFCALNINACTFYRLNVGAQIGNPALANLVTDVSAKSGVPPSLLAGIIRLESPDAFVSSDPNFVENDYQAFCTSSSGGGQCLDISADHEYTPSNPVKEGAWGLMQFLKPTFYSTYTSNKAEIDSRFNKNGLTTDVLPQSSSGSTGPSDKLRIYSIRDSIIATAYKLLNDNDNPDKSWDERVIKKVAKNYYGACAIESGGKIIGDYCNDLWTSYSACKTRGQGVGSGPLGLTVTCPLDPVNNENFAISTGTAKNPVNGKGHGGIGYAACVSPPYASCPYSPQLKSAIDVVLQTGATAGAPVYLPFINGNQSIEWNLIQGPTHIATANGTSWGYKMVYEGNYNGKKLTLDLTHLSSNISKSQTLRSGDKVGVVSSQVPHLHTAVAVDGVWVEAAKEAFMCFKE